MMNYFTIFSCETCEQEMFICKLSQKVVKNTCYMCVITKAQRAHNLMRKSYRFSPRQSLVGHLDFSLENKALGISLVGSRTQQQKGRSCLGDFCESCVSPLCNRKNCFIFLSFFFFYVALNALWKLLLLLCRSQMHQTSSTRRFLFRSIFCCGKHLI